MGNYGRRKEDISGGTMMYHVRRLAYRIWDSKVKIFSLLLILTLAFFDFAAMKNLFTKLKVSDRPLLPGGKLDPNTFLPSNMRGYISEINIYPMMMVILLEGIPYFLGLELSGAFDKTTYKANSKTLAIIGAIVSGVGLIGSFVLIIIMRLLVITLNVGWPDFSDGNAELSETFIVQIGLLISPILTSLLAIAISFTAFHSESAEKLEKKIDRLHVKFLNEQSKFYDILNKNDDARTALWSSLTSNQNGKIPARFDDFRKECFDRIRAKLIENVIIQYPGQISRFNAEIEGLLESCVNQMSNMDNVNDSYEIRSITPEQLFKNYDQSQRQAENGIDAWSYTIAGPELEKEMKKVLDNAVVVAQFKTAERPYHMEGDF